MTGPEFRAIRDKLSLTQGQLAAVLGYGAKSRIAEIEARAEVPGPTALAMQALVRFGMPETWPAE